MPSDRARSTSGRGAFEYASQWPAALHPDVLAGRRHETPYLVCDLDTAVARYDELTTEIPGLHCFYAVKCNSSTPLVETLAARGSRFEIASLAELRLLTSLGIDAREVLFSNPVKAPGHVLAAHAAGVWRYAFDSEGELRKLAGHAPGSAVYVRLRVDDSRSLFPLSRKFGADADEARRLMLLARTLGLRPYGVTFHVGSQCTAPTAWRQALAEVGLLLSRLEKDGIEVEMLNLGGGFPARYARTVPPLSEFAGAICSGLDELLPYRPLVIAAEPGRFIAAEAGVIVASVIGRESRGGENWLFIDVGAYNGLLETQQARLTWRFPLWSSRPDHDAVAHETFTVTGPTCDSSDTVFVEVSLPADLDVGDRLMIGSCGAYTLSYASHFNGFPPPVPYFVGGGASDGAAGHRGAGRPATLAPVPTV